MYDCAQSAITFNNLNLPSYDVHQKEARDQILCNFHALNQSFLQIAASHINKNKEQNERIERIRIRILQCQTRLSSLQGMDQALVFVSPALYPCKQEFAKTKNVSGFKDYLERTKLHKLDMKAQYSVKHELIRLGKESKVTVSTLESFVVFMLTQLGGKKKISLEHELRTKLSRNSLGRIPMTIKYVDSLTVFNTNINPYRKYQITETVYLAPKFKQVVQTANLPTTEGLKGFNNLNYEPVEKKYQPAVKTPDELDFELDLDLNGIVKIDSTEMTPVNIKAGIITKIVASDPFLNKSQINSSKITVTSQSREVPNISLPKPKIEEKSTLPPPLPQPNLLPPPLKQPIPTLTLPPPTLTLPPPTLTLPPPTLSLPPPIFGAPPSLPSSMSGSKPSFLAEIEGKDHMTRLKKTVTKETGIGTIFKPPEPEVKPAGAPMSFMEALQAKIRLRHEALHPKEDD